MRVANANVSQHRQAANKKFACTAETRHDAGWCNRFTNPAGPRAGKGRVAVRILSNESTVIWIAESAAVYRMVMHA